MKNHIIAAIMLLLVSAVAVRADDTHPILAIDAQIKVMQLETLRLQAEVLAIQIAAEKAARYNAWYTAHGRGQSALVPAKLDMTPQPQQTIGSSTGRRRCNTGSCPGIFK